MIERTLDIKTEAGAMTTFVVHPERDAPHPAVLFLMDAAGIREELRDMARRLATSGYYVLLPNLYYRKNALELPKTMSIDDMGVLARSLSMQDVMEDCDAALGFAEGDLNASKGKWGVVGYCMTGQHAVNVAARHPDKIGAAASFYGVRLVSDQPYSPHLAMQKAKAEFYFACAELDQHASMDMVNELAATVRAKKVNAEVEIFRGLDHGFAFPSRAVYDKAGDARHWERQIALYRRNLT